MLEIFRWKKKRFLKSLSALIKWCEAHKQSLIKTLVSHPELSSFQLLETGLGLLNNAVCADLQLVCCFLVRVCICEKRGSWCMWAAN